MPKNFKKLYWLGLLPLILLVYFFWPHPKHDLEASIRLDNPLPNQVISSSLKIEGQARGHWYFEAAFPFFLYDDQGEVLAAGTAQAKSDWMMDDFVPFTADLVFSLPEKEEGVLVLKKANPSALAENDESLAVPVIFSTSTRDVSLYFYKQDQDCDPASVLAVQRKISFTSTPIQDTLNLLLQGRISAEEKAAGFSTEFPLAGFKLKGADLKDGRLILEFDDPLFQSGGGSCRVTLLRQQIYQTARQFPEVLEIEFKPEYLFQP